MNRKIKINSESIFSLTIGLELLLPACKYCVLQSIPGLSVYNTSLNGLISLILMPFILISFYFARKELKFILFSFILFIIPIIYTFIFFPDNCNNLIEVLPKLLTVSYPMLCISYAINDYKKLFNTLINVSRIILIFAVYMQINIFIYGNVGSYDNTYSMSLGYYCVVPIGILLCNYREMKSKIDFVLFLSGIMIIFIMGSRGPLLSICIVILYLYLRFHKLTKRKFIITLIISFCIILGIIYFNQILDFMIDLLESYNVSSRTLIYIKYGEIASLDSRIDLQADILKGISNIGVFGNGVLSQNRLHNIFLENLFSYGYIIGLFFDISLVIIVLVSFFRKFEKIKCYLIIVFLSYAIVDASLNLTVLGKDIFWIFIGLFFAINNTRRKRIES